MIASKITTLSYRPKRKIQAVVTDVWEDNTIAHGIKHFHERGNLFWLGRFPSKRRKLLRTLKKPAFARRPDAKQNEREITLSLRRPQRGPRGHRCAEHGRARNRYFARRKIRSPWTRVAFLKNAAGNAVRASTSRDRFGCAGAPTASRPSSYRWCCSSRRENFSGYRRSVEDGVVTISLNSAKPTTMKSVALGGLPLWVRNAPKPAASGQSNFADRGRQGDPGSSRFFFLLKMDLMRIAAVKRAKR